MINTRTYLHYHRVVFNFTKRKYDLGHADLDMIIFLTHEGIFNRYKMEEFAKIITWEDKRFYKLMNAGWFISMKEYRVLMKKEVDGHAAKYAQIKRYTASRKAKLMIAKMYNLLEGKLGQDQMGSVSDKSEFDAPYASQAYTASMNRMFAAQKRVNDIRAEQKKAKD